MRELGPLAALVAALTVLAMPALAPAAVHDPFERAVADAVGVVRAQHGIAPLRPSPRLARVARHHSLDQLRHQRLSHDAGDGTPFSRRMARVSRSSVGETVGWMPDGTAAAAFTIVQIWLASPAHRAELLDRRFRRIGVGRRWGLLTGLPGTVVTVDLGAPAPRRR